MVSRRQFLKMTGMSALALATLRAKWQAVLAQIPGGTLDPLSITKYMTPLLIPPVMPQSDKVKQMAGQNVDYYEISVREFMQQILPVGMPATKVWGYGAVNANKKKGLLLHNAPSLTIEAHWNRPTRVKWVNELVDANGNYLPHILPVDPTLHWANPPGGIADRDTRPTFASTPGAYTGPVPLVTHVHGAVGVGDESDGYTEAWYLPAAANIPAGYATQGTWYDFLAGKAAAKGFLAPGKTSWEPGSSVFQYPNVDRASTNWYHDHALGMTRLNVYAGPAGFFIIRGGPDGDKAVLDSRTGLPAVLPGPAPMENDQFPPNKTYFEIPIVIQDRSFNADGSLFYPDTREFFDEIVRPYIPDGEFSPIWNPEFFGNTMMVNGNTWPFLDVQQARYRIRFLNGCQSRFLILDFNAIPGLEVWQIGNEGGFLAAPVNLSAVSGNQLLMALAERADVILDFTNVPVGNYVLGNVGPDEPYGGGVPGEDFDPSDAASTGQVMEFRVGPALVADPSTPPAFLTLPPIVPLPVETFTRKLALIEAAGVGFNGSDEEVEGPVEALLGNVDADGFLAERLWMNPVTENPAVGAVEMWEIYNTTADAHPMHIHELVFEVINREGLVLNGEGEVAQPVALDGNVTPPEPWENGLKDTVISYPGQVIRLRMQFNTPGQYVWHCHIVEHEDNEMMRPFRIGPLQPGQPAEGA